LTKKKAIAKIVDEDGVVFERGEEIEIVGLGEADSEDETHWYDGPIHVVHNVDTDLGLEIDLSTIGLSRREMREMEDLLPMLLGAGGAGGGYREGF
jgi:hypothetical protein